MTTDAPASATEAAWERLWSRLALREGFWLGFVFQSNLDLLRELEARSERYRRGKARGVEVFHAAAPDDLRDTLGVDPRPAPWDNGPGWVVGVGNPKEWFPAWDWFLRRLNEQRDTLVEVVPGGVVLAGSEGLLPVARAAAPDLWNYLSVTIDGTALAQPGGFLATPPVQPEGDRDEVAFARWALEEPVQPSPDLRPVLQEVAAQLQAGRGGAATRLAAGAVDRAVPPTTSRSPRPAWRGLWRSRATPSAASPTPSEPSRWAGRSGRGRRRSSSTSCPAPLTTASPSALRSATLPSAACSRSRTTRARPRCGTCRCRWATSWAPAGQWWGGGGLRVIAGAPAHRRAVGGDPRGDGGTCRFRWTRWATCAPARATWRGRGWPSRRQ